MNPSWFPASSLLGNSGKGRGSYGVGYGEDAYWKNWDWGGFARIVPFRGGCFDGEDWVGLGWERAGLCIVSQGGIKAL